MFQPDLLVMMSNDLAHRGPDSKRILNQPGVGLVFRRLSILDPSTASDQPMTDESGRFTIVYNGEIYNYRSLRDDLKARGARFRTTGDTEVLLQGYMHWGEDVLSRLEGMYAFVIVDRHAGKVIAARDPFGIKPLYLLRRNNLIALASEVRPLCRLIAPEPDTDALAELLLFRFAAGRLSNYKNIDRIPGGHMAKFNLDSTSYTEVQYCDTLESLRHKKSTSVEIAQQEVESAVRRSVKDHLASDVGYAVQLSGGIDSSLITVLAAGETGTPLHSFGVSLGRTPHDEAPYRAEVVARAHTTHHELPVTSKVFADSFARAVKHMEGPSPHLGCVLLMLLCDTIRDHTKVVLTGEGADEFFGGYQRYEIWRQLRQYRRFARLVPKSAWPWLQRYRAISIYADHDPSVYASVFSDFLELSDLFPALVPKPGSREATASCFSDFRDKLFAVDQTAYLESLLLRQDKMAMAASVEARVPFTHVPLARVANRLPHRIRAPGGRTKPILKSFARRFFDDPFVDRRKVGLTMPLKEWLAVPDGLGRFLDLLTEPNARLTAYGEPNRIKQLVNRFRKGDGASARKLVHLINLELWLRSVTPPVPANTENALAN